jgi:hypothetical protein
MPASSRALRRVRHAYRPSPHAVTRRTQVCAGYEVMVSGDLNDFDAQVLDAANSTPRSRVLDLLKGVTAADGGPLLQNVGALMARIATARKPAEGGRRRLITSF